MKLRELVEYLDSYLRIAEIPDYPTALNGLQIESEKDIRQIAVAVDGSERAIAAALADGCDLLIVHHGLFWGGLQAVTGRLYRKLKLAMDGGLAVYGCHIPLDLHPEVGNSPVLAQALGVRKEGEWADYKGFPIGVFGTLETTRDGLADQLRSLLGGTVTVLPGGPDRIQRVGVITGSAAGYIAEGIQLGLDAFVTGEGAHHTYFDAVEGGINVYYGGHYQTETFGVKALAAHLERRFGIPWVFLDQPTGL